MHLKNVITQGFNFASLHPQDGGNEQCMESKEQDYFLKYMCFYNFYFSAHIQTVAISLTASNCQRDLMMF
jgi:hypothetical protein